MQDIAAAATSIPDIQLFHDVFNASPIGIAVENLEGQPLFVNPAFCSFLGFSEEELRNKHCVDFSPREDAEKDWALFQQLRAGSIDRYQLEKRYFRRDGSLVWGSLSISLLHSRPSALVLAMVEDITAKKTAEEARLRLAAIVESSNDAIIGLDLSGTVADWNRGAEQLFGYSYGEAVGEKVSFLSPPGGLEEVGIILKKVSSGEAVKNYETVRRRKDGSRVDISLTLSPIVNAAGRVVGMSGIMHDITERRRAEEAVCMSEERFRLAALAGKMFAYEWDAATDVIVRSAEFTHVLGNDEPIETTGQKILERMHPDDRERVKAAVATLSPENPHLRISYRIGRRDGTFVWVERTSRAHFDEQGTMLRLVGMIADKTDLKQAEGAVSAMTRKLVEAQEQERARIARELHDDISQRLALVAVELEQLQDDPSEVGRLVPELRKRMTEISSYVQALSHDLHSSKLEYLGVVAGIVGWCKEFAERQKIEIDCRYDVRSTLPQEIGLCLFRVLQEALHNAAKHSGVKRIEVELSEKSGELHLTIRDLGKGFDVEAVKQAKGLGLTSMRERVRLVNGTITIDSKQMGGTVIRVRVPLDTTTELIRAAG